MSSSFFISARSYSYPTCKVSVGRSELDPELEPGVISSFIVTSTSTLTTSCRPMFRGHPRTIIIISIKSSRDSPSSGGFLSNLHLHLRLRPGQGFGFMFRTRIGNDTVSDSFCDFPFHRKPPAPSPSPYPCYMPDRLRHLPLSSIATHTPCIPLHI